MDLGPSFTFDHCQFQKKGLRLSRQPLAVVRFTAYDEYYGFALKVNETVYPKSPKGVEQLKGQILAALDAGFDVSVVTTCQIGEFIELLDFANQP